ncbi:hypothetical protein GPECTOR_3g281 [Gonium pectorale]|uniref:PBP domain-containing protein n=1 Tax=Gonium pectorale TaxID=33097 RepID=A0A150H0P5_GONPE|nr:hypothetical protein GPECTOR_3g281 [Gonium pectorale]|eukprot:KXZ55130.1 hypothetical protein GPECTOR_3g281 [Gonium pectorale]
MLKAFRMFETMATVPLQVLYRVTTSPNAAEDIALDAGQQTSAFAVTERPLSSAARSNFTSNPVLNDAIHFPLYVNSYALLYNVPGNKANPLNMTACLAARILKGEILEWTHPDFLDKNPAFVKAASDSYKITLFVEGPLAGGTLAVLDWLATACPSSPVAYSTIRKDAVLTSSSNMVSRLMSTSFSFGWAAGIVGRGAVAEFAVETGIAGQYVVSGATNTTSLFGKLPSVIPTGLTGDYSGVTVANLAASKVAPILTVAYLVTKRDWSRSTDAEGQLGEAILALCQFFHRTEIAGNNTANGMIAEYGMLPVGDAVMNATRASLETAFIRRSTAVPFTFIDGNGASVLSPTRTSFDIAAYNDVITQVAALRKALDVGASRVMRGAGSSAITLFIWRCFSEMRARSTSPIHMVYRASGSGSGQSETIAKSNGYQSLLDFGVSDTPMPDASYSDLTANGKVQLVHIPVLLLPMNFFVNIPNDALPSRQLRMSPCTIAKIMQADITSWSHPDITADNGFTLPDQPIVVFYRQLSSGTTSVITAYLSNACSSWRLGSGGLLSNWPATFKPTANSVNMSTSVANTPWSIGYMDTANGLELNLMEIAIRNKDGNYVTSQTGDISGAASALFKSDAWPKTPTRSFSSVSVLNQPGANTFPIVAMPFMLVRTDLTSRGDSGALLLAFLTFMLDNVAQNTIAPALGFAALPAEVRQYTLDRAMPLLLVDARAKAWAFEGSKGSSDYVISSFAGNYESSNAQAFADFYKAYNIQRNALQSSKALNSTNTTAINASALADVPADLKYRLDKMQRQIVTLQAIAITGVTFGIVGLALALFSTCRIFVHATLMNGTSINPMPGLPGSMLMASGVRRQKSSGNLSESSFGDM